MKNIWILSEERPKPNVIYQIIEKFSLDYGHRFRAKNIRIFPLLSDDKFTFTYLIKGIVCEKVKDIFIKIASGNSSFVDFLLFYQDEEPTIKSTPLYAIEETKTDDSESRNTGVYQRCSKFVFVDFYYPNIRKIMLYDLQIPQKENPTQTNIFGTRMLIASGVEILGKKIDYSIMKPFKNLEELIDFKNSMRPPPKGNVPIRIKEHSNKIMVSGRLIKNNSLSHDPNIGALTMIASCIRKWEKNKPIIIVLHGLKQENVGRTNKFLQIANKLNIKLSKLRIPNVEITEDYWHYERSGEKVGSIFLHLLIETYTKGRVIYTNHAGGERGYFFDKKNNPIVVPKYKKGQRESYKKGDKRAIIFIPDVIIYDQKRNEVLNIEAKRFVTRKQGINELNNYTYIEKYYIKPLYKPSKIVRSVVIFGSKQTSISEKEICFMLNENGVIILRKDTPLIIREAVQNLLASQ